MTDPISHTRLSRHTLADAIARARASRKPGRPWDPHLIVGWGDVQNATEVHGRHREAGGEALTIFPSTITDGSWMVSSEAPGAATREHKRREREEQKRALRELLAEMSVDERRELLGVSG